MSSKIAACFAALFVVGGSGAAQAAEHLRIATEGAYPPFNSIAADGKLVGFDIDIANALCAHMKAECEIVAQDWDGLIPGLQAQKFDAVIASMTITEERRSQVAFTHKYYATPLAIAVPKDSALKTTDAAALAGKTVGVQAASVIFDFVDKAYRQAGADIRAYPSYEEATADLANGRLDAVVSDKIFLAEWLKKDGAGCCRMAGDIPASGTEAGIAVRLDDTALRDRLDAALAAILKDGTYKAIETKYFDFDIY
ncbi:MAG: transporter substrate-binding domain-containing protein [Mesorhizobium sp.]|nr:transporter substrate-binding domain-containing protein [Mesorhizobium sp.]MBN9241829.1 transporter substrate-binding domain-containing protein [Mesorhizobium sp.]